MRSLRQAGFAVVALLVLSSVASAQRTRASAAGQQRSVWELGLDAALSFGLDDPRVTTLSIPVSNLRAGIFTSDVLEIEPFFALNYFKVEGLDAVTSYQFGAGGLYHFSPERTKRQVYVRPFVALAGISTSGASDSNVGLGVGVGMKLPRMNGRLAWRGEFNVANMNDATSLNFLWGASYFTR
jgi:hypothetical protein